MRKIRVLQANKLYYPVTGGIEKVVQDISEGFRDDEEIENQVLVCQRKGRGNTEQVNGVTIIRCSSFGVVSSLPVSPEFLWKFRHLSMYHDIVHIHAPFPLGDLACLLSGYRGKVVVWWHSDIVRQKKLMKFYRPLMEWLLRRADAIVTATEGNIEGSLYLGDYREKCHVIPFGIDQELMAHANSYLKSKLERKAAGNGMKFLFAGRLVYYKGCDVLLRAFAGLKSATARLDIIGDGTMRQELEELSKKLGIEDSVEFLGEVSRRRLLESFSECDVFILPSVAPSEAFGIVQIEAMAYGKPVINTNLKSGVPYVSLNGCTGLTVEPGNVEQLREAMRCMMDQPDLRRQFGINAAVRARKVYSMDYMISQVKTLYRELFKDGTIDE